MTTYARESMISLLLVFLYGNILLSQISDTVPRASDQQIKLAAYVEQSRVPVNRTVVLRIELSWPGKLNRYQVEPVSQPILTNLLLEGSGSENRLETHEDGNLYSIKAITYRLRPLEMGMAYIDGIVIRYFAQESGEEEKLSSQRIMIEIIEPIPEEDSGKLKALVYIILLVIFFAIIAYFLILYFRKKRLSRQKPTPSVSLGEMYLNRLAHEVDPRGTNLDEMISRLSRIFREYLAQEFQMPAREMNNQEIIRRLAELDIDPIDKQNLSAVFQKLDVIKFSGKGIDPNEFTHTYGTIENFLLKRKQLFEASQSESKEEK